MTDGWSKTWGLASGGPTCLMGGWLRVNGISPENRKYKTAAPVLERGAHLLGFMNVRDAIMWNDRTRFADTVYSRIESSIYLLLRKKADVREPIAMPEKVVADVHDGYLSS